MNKKSFIWGVVTGIILTLSILFIIGLASQNTDSIQYLEKPIKYENKSAHPTNPVGRVYGC